MDINLGNLKFLPAKEHPELMSPVVFDAISKLPEADKIGVAEIDPNLSDTSAFCAEYKVGMNQVAKVPSTKLNKLTDYFPKGLETKFMAVYLIQLPIPMATSDDK